MGAIKNAIKKQVKNVDVQRILSTTGKVLAYDKTLNTARIAYANPMGEGWLYRDGVHISNSLGGLTSNGIRTGCQCILTFVNGHIEAPMITGICDSTYAEKSCADQGAYLIDESIRESSSDTLEIDTPMYQNWIDENNTWEDKYNNDFGDYTSYDMRQETHRLSTETHRYSDSEIGLTHLDTKSTIKLKDNGDIDIFVADNVGIRISKKQKKIYFYGFDININGEMDILAILRKCRDCEFDGYHDKEEPKPILDDLNDLILLIDQDIEELKRCIAYTKEITGDIQYFAYLDNAIAQYEAIKSSYLMGQYSHSQEALDEVYNKIMWYYKYFQEELVSARERWGLA